MIHVLSNLPIEYDVILDGLKNCLVASGDNALIIKVKREKFINLCKKIKNKNEENREKENGLGTYNKHCKQKCHKCG